MRSSAPNTTVTVPPRSPLMPLKSVLGPPPATTAWTHVSNEPTAAASPPNVSSAPVHIVDTRTGFCCGG
jgi:hypothetical protein